MARTLLVSFSGPSDTHRIRNFAEDLSRALAVEPKLGSLPIEHADAAIDSVCIADIPARQMKRTVALVRAILSAHNYADDASVLPGG